ncbi:protein unc-93 homolog A-like isoform X2 [Apostichopus japonicus]|uniref:protein unc-93 homolog A-like isoform X2 n=1 Tax=Stichopus japonicus TaxID=307972 RepID=UPI003AB33A65
MDRQPKNQFELSNSSTYIKRLLRKKNYFTWKRRLTSLKMSTLESEYSNTKNQNVLNNQYRRVPSRIFSRKRHWKNLFVLSLTFLFCFTAYGAIQNIQSSVNTSNGLGFLSLAIVYGSFMLSSLLAPTVIKYFGAKWTIVFATLCYCIYSYANFFPSFASLIPASFLLGFSAGPLWVAQGTYFTTSAIQLAELINDVPEFVISRFNGVLFAFFQFYQIWGNILSFTILDAGMENQSPTNFNSCGSQSCGAPIESNQPSPGKNEVQLLFCIFSVIGMLAVLLSMCFLDEQPSATTRIETDTGSSLSLVLSTVRLMGNFQLFLLIPVFVYTGIEQAFMFGDFTKSYITCTQGISAVGLVMIAYGVSDVISSLICGQLEKITGRIFLFCLGSVVHAGLLVYLYIWIPNQQDEWQLYLVAVGWGVGDAVFQTQCASIIGVFFAGCQEPAFSNYRFWQAAGFCSSFVLSIPDGICIFQKILGICIWLLFSMITYFVCEYKISSYRCFVTGISSTRVDRQQQQAVTCNTVL